MALGDINSNERGSGARYNDGKPDFSLVPLHIIARGYLGNTPGSNGQRLAASLFALGQYQITGQRGHLNLAIRLVSFAWDDCARVLEYGRNKYAAWNWSKGMKWSAPLACAGRHALKVLQKDELIDDESLLPHIGHYLANLVMLATFIDSYPEGNDLPAPSMFVPTPPIPPTPSAVLDPHFA